MFLFASGIQKESKIIAASHMASVFYFTWLESPGNEVFCCFMSGAAEGQASSDKETFFEFPTNFFFYFAV